MYGIVLDCRIKLSVFSVALQTAHKGTAHFTRKTGILTVGFVSASPSWVSENIDIGPDFEVYKYNGSKLEKLEQLGYWDLYLEILTGKGMNDDDGFAFESLAYCMIVAAIIPIIIIYPFIQKYFAAGVNLGGVKE